MMLRQAQHAKIDLLGQDYSAEKLEADIQNVKPRIFDTYILPGFMMYYAWKSKGMKKVARRILFTSGVYMMYRNYSVYKEAFLKLQAVVAERSRSAVAAANGSTGSPTEGGTPA